MKLVCKDYGFECDFVSKNEDGSSVIEEFGKHTLQEHGIDYSEEVLTQFIIRKRVWKKNESTKFKDTVHWMCGNPVWRALQL